MRRWISVLAAVCVLGQGALAQQGQQKSFVACPMVRDTATVPCFLAEYEGETYFLGTSQSPVVPQLKHQVLVEGTVSNGTRVCGGVKLDPVAISVLPEVNLGCNVVLPSEPGITAPAVQPANPLPLAERYVVQYEFDSDRAPLGTITVFADYANREGGTVKVTATRGASKLSDGRILTEKEGLAERRANAIAAALRGLGVNNVIVEAQHEAVPPDGINDASHRRVEASLVR